MALKITFLYLYAFIVGLSWTTIPALSTLITSAACQDLQSISYGGLMMAIIICAIFSSIASGTIFLKYGMKKILLTGVFCSLLSSLFLFSSEFFVGSTVFNYLILLVSQSLLGLSIGMSLTALNVYIENLITKFQASFLVAMYACLGLGSTFAPIYYDDSTMGCHWQHKVLFISAALAFLLMMIWKFLPVIISHTKTFKWMKVKNIHFWLFALLPFCYGLMEESITVWAPVSLFKDAGWTRATSELGLTYFWGCITFFQVFIAILCLKIPAKWIYYFLSVLMAIAFYLFSNGAQYVDKTWIFAFAGMGFSAFYSLSVHLGEKRFPDIIEIISGMFVCAYMCGAALSALGIGVLMQILQVTFSQIYAIFIILAALMCIMSIYLLQKSKSEI